MIKKANPWGWRMTFKSFPRIAALFFLLVLPLGCATRNALHLQNIFEYYAEQKELRKAKAAKKAAELSKKELLEAKSRAVIEEPFDPPELNLLKLPGAFKRVNQSDLKTSGAKKKIEASFPGFTGVWTCADCDIAVLAGKVAVDPKRVQSLSAAQLRGELEKMGILYQKFYQNKFKAGAAVKIRKSGGVSILKIESKYLVGSEWNRDLRYFYFYNLSYRLKMLITGPDKAFQELAPKILGAINAFEKKLSNRQR